MQRHTRNTILIVLSIALLYLVSEVAYRESIYRAQQRRNAQCPGEDHPRP